MQSFDDEIRATWEQVRCTQYSEDQEAAWRQHRLAKRRKKDFAKKCRARFIKHKISELHQHMDNHDMGRFHLTLKQLGLRNVMISEDGLCRFGLQEMKEHNERVSSGKTPVNPQIITNAVPQHATDETLGRWPASQEIYTI